MANRNSLRQRVTQQFRVAPILTTSITGAALGALICLVVFLWGSFGNNQKAVANKTTKQIQEKSIPANMAGGNNDNNQAGSANTIYNSVKGEPRVLAIPTEIKAGNITNTCLNIKWKGTPAASFYKVRISVSGANAWAYTTQKSKQIKLDKLEEYTSYDVQIQGYSATDSSGWSAVQTFKTGRLCGIPQGLTTTKITATTAMAHWAGNPNILQYSVRYREQGQLEWSDDFEVSGNANRFVFSSLKAGASYEWQVRCQCPFGDNSWSDYQPATFTTTGSTTSTGADLNAETGVSAALNNQLKVSPNPNNGQFMVEMNFGKTEVKTARLELTNLAGQVLIKQNLAVENNVISESMQIGSSLPQGFYIVKVTGGGEVYQTQISLNRD